MSTPHSIDQRDDKRRRFGSLSGRDLALILAPVAVLIALGAWLTAKSSHLAAPGTIRITSGLDGSSYRRFADKYKAIIERYGVKVEVVPSAGLRTPPSFGDQLYVLRDHVAAVRRRVHDDNDGEALAS